MDRRDALAESVLTCKQLLARYLAGFDETTRVRQVPNLPNHVAWSLGHCALTMQRATEKLSGRAFPPEDSPFLPGATRGDATRFGAEGVALGSRPTDDPTAYPSLERARAIFDSACDRLAAAVRAAPDARLDETIPWGQIQLTVQGAIARMIFHNGFHCGQIADLRRALGMKSIFA